MAITVVHTPVFPVRCDYDRLTYRSKMQREDSDITHQSCVNLLANLQIVGGCDACLAFVSAAKTTFFSGEALTTVRMQGAAASCAGRIHYTRESP